MSPFHTASFLYTTCKTYQGIKNTYKHFSVRNCAASPQVSCMLRNSSFSFRLIIFFGCNALSNLHWSRKVAVHVQSSTYSCSSHLCISAPRHFFLQPPLQILFHYRRLLCTSFDVHPCTTESACRTTT